MSDPAPWSLYPTLRDRVITMVSSLSDDAVAQTVPLTAEWTVWHVLAHVCGLNTDIVAGAREDLGSDERTRAQVASCAGLSVAEICERWAGLDAVMQEITAEVPLLEQRLAADLVVHLHDIQHALGQAIDRSDVATLSAAHVYALRSPDRWVGLTGVNVRVELDDGYGAGAEAPDVTLRCSPYDFLRSVTGRRSRRQVEALGWSSPAPSVIDHFSPYTTLGDVDVEV